MIITSYDIRVILILYRSKNRGIGHKNMPKLVPIILFFSAHLWNVLLKMNLDVRITLFLYLFWIKKHAKGFEIIFVLIIGLQVWFCSYNWTRQGLL